LQLGSRLDELLSSRFYGVGSLQSLADLGLSFKADGTLALDAGKLNAQLAANRDGVEKFFATEDSGISNRFKALLDDLSGANDSLLSLGIKGLSDTIDVNKAKLSNMQDQLDEEKNQLYTKFYNMELAVSKLQSSLNALSSIDWILNSNYKSNNNNS
jgi:flagellar hook-associated protein 2